MKKIENITILKTISILALLFALGSHPYSYYQLLRWFTCGVSCYLAYQTSVNKKTIWVWIFVIIAILFNPIAPLYFDRDTWTILNIAAAITFIISIFRLELRSYGTK